MTLRKKDSKKKFVVDSVSSIILIPLLATTGGGCCDCSTRLSPVPKSVSSWSLFKILLLINRFYWVCFFINLTWVMKKVADFFPFSCPCPWWCPWWFGLTWPTVSCEESDDGFLASLLTANDWADEKFERSGYSIALASGWSKSSRRSSKGNFWILLTFVST